MKNAGFSLLELVITLLILAILSVSLLWEDTDGPLGVMPALNLLAGDIRYIQHYAMMRGQNTRINFASDHYWYSNQNNSAVIAHPTWQLSPIPLDSGATLSSSVPFIIFDNLGIPYINIAPWTALTLNATLTITQSGANRNLIIRPETGQVWIP